MYALTEGLPEGILPLIWTEWMMTDLVEVYNLFQPTRNTTVDSAVSQGQQPSKPRTEAAAQLRLSAKNAEDHVREWLATSVVEAGAPQWVFKEVGFLVREDGWPHSYGVSPDGICEERQVGLEVKEVGDEQVYNYFLSIALEDDCDLSTNGGIEAADGEKIGRNVQCHVKLQHPQWWAQIQLGFAVTGFSRWVLALRYRDEKLVCAGFLYPDTSFIQKLIVDISVVQLFRDAMAGILDLRQQRVLNGGVVTFISSLVGLVRVAWEDGGLGGGWLPEWTID